MNQSRDRISLRIGRIAIAGQGPAGVVAAVLVTLAITIAAFVGVLVGTA